MSEQEQPFDPSMFKNLDELRAAFPEQAENFAETEDGKGFARKGLVENAEIARKLASEDLKIQEYIQRIEAFLAKSTNEKDKERIESIIPNSTSKFSGLVSLSLVEYWWHHFATMVKIPEDEYRALCEIPDEEKNQIEAKLVDLGTEPDLMSHGTPVSNLDLIAKVGGIIAHEPRFTKRWKGMEEFKSSRPRANEAHQGLQSISCYDPHYRIELLKDALEGRSHKFYSLFLSSDKRESPELAELYKNHKLSPQSPIYQEISDEIQAQLNCSVIAINSVYRTNGRLIIHGEFELDPEKLKDFLFRELVKEDQAFQRGGYNSPPQLSERDEYLKAQLTSFSEPQAVINGLGFYKVSVSLILEPSAADLESGKIVRNALGIQQLTTANESDWESRIPSSRIVGVKTRKILDLPAVVDFARKLKIPIYDTEGNVIWPREIARDKISQDEEEVAA